MRMGPDIMVFPVHMDITAIIPAARSPAMEHIIIAASTRFPGMVRPLLMLILTAPGRIATRQIAKSNGQVAPQPVHD